MGPLSRRQFTGILGGGVAASLSGCTEALGEYLGNDEEGELLVVSTNLRIPKTPGSETSYPADIQARIVIENRRPDRQKAQLEATLRHTPEGESAQSWTQTRELNLSRGVSPTILMLFPSVLGSGDKLAEFEVDAEIIEQTTESSESTQ